MTKRSNFVCTKKNNPLIKSISKTLFINNIKKDSKDTIPSDLHINQQLIAFRQIANKLAIPDRKIKDISSLSRL